MMEKMIEEEGEDHLKCEQNKPNQQKEELKAQGKMAENEEIWNNPNPRKYMCKVTLDPNTALYRLFLSEENKKVEDARKDLIYPDHPDRFDCYGQVLSVESFTGRCYWEAEWSGEAEMAVSYRGIQRKGLSYDCRFGLNSKSWKLFCSDTRFAVSHNNKETLLPPDLPRSHRVGVYLDWPAGTLSFYSFSDTHTLTHLHTFHSTFTEPLYAGFTIFENSSVRVCKIE